jgi:hypothetical protein
MNYFHPFNICWDVFLLIFNACTSKLCADKGFGMAFKKYVTIGTVTTSVGVVVICSLGIILFRANQISVGNTWGVQGAGVLSAVAIVILGTIYKKIAIMLTDWENHRTDIDYEDALISKTFIFEFCNNYIGLFYIAFLKPLFGPQIAETFKLNFNQPCLPNDELSALHDEAFSLAKTPNGKKLSYSEASNRFIMNAQIRIISIMFNSTYNSTEKVGGNKIFKDGKFVPGQFPISSVIDKPNVANAGCVPGAPDVQPTYGKPGILGWSATVNCQNEFDTICGAASGEFLKYRIYHFICLYV